MMVAVGETLVFAAGSTDRPWHFSNFEVGRSYVVERIDSEEHGYDECGYLMADAVVSFRGCRWAVYLGEANRYFVSPADYRSMRLSVLDL